LILPHVIPAFPLLNRLDSIRKAEVASVVWADMPDAEVYRSRYGKVHHLPQGRSSA